MKTHYQQCILMKLLDEAVSDALKRNFGQSRYIPLNQIENFNSEEVKISILIFYKQLILIFYK